MKNKVDPKQLIIFKSKPSRIISGYYMGIEKKNGEEIAEVEKYTFINVLSLSKETRNIIAEELNKNCDDSVCLAREE